MLGRSPQSLASSFRHVWAGPVPVVVTFGFPRVSEDTLVLNMRECLAMRHGRKVRMPHDIFKMFAAIACGGREVSKVDIAEFMWGDREDGGPDSWHKIIDIQVFRMRRLVRPLGIAITNRYTFGFAIADIPRSRILPTATEVQQATGVVHA